MSIDRRGRAFRRHRRLAGAGDAAKARYCVFFLFWFLLSSHLPHLYTNEALCLLHHRTRRSFPPPSPTSRGAPCGSAVVAFRGCGASAEEARGGQFRTCDEPQRCDAPPQHKADRRKRTNTTPPSAVVALSRHEMPVPLLWCHPTTARTIRKNKNKNSRRSLLLVGCV